MVDFSVPRQGHPVHLNRFSLLSAEGDAQVESQLFERMDIPVTQPVSSTWVDSEGQEGFPLREVLVRPGGWFFGLETCHVGPGHF